MESIYLDKSLNYPLDKLEYENIDKAWKFLKNFRKPYVHVTDYRNYLVKKINKKYNIDEFYTYETIINKLFWNLREKIKEFYDNTECQSVTYDNSNLDHKLGQIVEKLGTYYRSFINKLIIIDKNNKKIYYKKMEGSSNIFNNSNNFNLLTLDILFNRELYEDVMGNPIDKKKIQSISLPKYYYQLDYGFPNLNCCQYSIGTSENKIERIQKMYYNGNYDYWYKLL